MATHSSILAWRIPWTEEPVGLQSMESQRDWHNWATNAFRHVGSVVVPGLSCPVACGIFRGQESNLLASWFFTARWPGKSPTKYFKCRHYELSKSQKCFHTAFQTRNEKATAASDRVSHQTVSMERLRKSYPVDTADVCWMRTQLKKKNHSTPLPGDTAVCQMNSLAVNMKTELISYRKKCMAVL